MFSAVGGFRALRCPVGKRGPAPAGAIFSRAYAALCSEAYKDLCLLIVPREMSSAFPFEDIYEMASNRYLLIASRTTSELRMIKAPKKSLLSEKNRNSGSLLEFY